MGIYSLSGGSIATGMISGPADKRKNDTIAGVINLAGTVMQEWGESKFAEPTLKGIYQMVKQLPIMQGGK